MPEWKSQKTVSSKEDKAEFARRCLLLGDIYHEIPEDKIDDLLASMFAQSEIIIGIQ